MMQEQGGWKWIINRKPDPSSYNGRRLETIWRLTRKMVKGITGRK